MHRDDSRSPAPRKCAHAVICRVAGLMAMLTPILLAGLLGWHSLGDADIWLHQRIGNEFLAGHGWLGNADLTFASPEYPWTNHEPLFQLVAAWTGPAGPPAPASRVTGWNTLRLVLVLILVLGLVSGERRWALLHEGAPPPNAWLGIPWILGLMLLWPRLILRPELLSYLLLIFVVRRVECALQGERTFHARDLLDPRRPEGSFLWLTWIWAWIHGFAALAPVLWILGGLCRVLQRWLPGMNRPTTASIPWPRWFLVLGLSLVALAATPSGLDGVIYPLRALGQFGSDSIDLRRVISELVPLLETRNMLHWTLLAFRLSLVWSMVLVGLGWGRIPLLRVLMLGLAAAAALSAQRNLGVYAVAFWLAHENWAPAVGFRSLSDRLRRGIPDSLARYGTWLAVALTVTLGAVWSQSIVRDDFYLREGVSRRFGGGLTPAQMPLAAIDSLPESAAEKVFANLNAAGPAIDRAGARLFLDGRTEAHPPADWARYRQVLQGGTPALQTLNSMAPTAVILGGTGSGSSRLARTLIEDPHWKLEAVEEGGFVFLPNAKNIDNSLRLNVMLQDMDKRLEGDQGPISGAREADRLLAAASHWKLADNPARREELLRRGLRARPDHPTLLHNLGNLLQARGDHLEALVAFDGALRMNPQLAGSALNRGASLMALRRFRGARESFERAVAIDSRLFEGWVNLGLACRQLGESEKSRAAFARALELRPHDERVRRLLQNRR